MTSPYGANDCRVRSTGVMVDEVEMLEGKAATSPLSLSSADVELDSGAAECEIGRAAV